MKILTMQPRTLLPRLTVALALAAASQLCFAQFVWRDSQGVKQYSDMPPPSSVPRNKILKSPGITTPNTTPTTAPSITPSAFNLAVPAGTENAAGTATTATKNASPMSTAERNADYTKRKMDEAEQAKKSSAAAKLASDKKSNCDRARSYSRSLEEGTRITNTDSTGERSYLNDEQRAQEVRNTQRVLAECK